MKAFLDTSVLVAVFYGDHPHHDVSLDLFLRLGKKAACCSIHSLAEVYATLTGMPGKHRVSGDTAVLFLNEIQEHLTLVGLNAEEYAKTLAQAANANLCGGAVYDALHANCAEKAGARVIYTWNAKDFMRVSPAIAARVRRPDQPA